MVVKLLRINLGYLCKLGFPLGHIFKTSSFFSLWMLYKRSYILQGDSPLILPYEIFFMNIWFTWQGLRILRRTGRIGGLVYAKALFVCQHYYFGPLVGRYALVGGAGFVVFDWINGMCTNAKLIFAYFTLLYFDWIDRYKMGQRHRMFLIRLWGFGVNLGFGKPEIALISRLVEGKLAGAELGQFDVLSFGLLDSNILGGGLLSIPLPGNDDSIQCVNLVNFILARRLLDFRILGLLRWENLWDKNRKKTLATLGFMYHFLQEHGMLTWENLFLDYLGLDPVLRHTVSLSPRYKDVQEYFVKLKVKTTFELKELSGLIEGRCFDDVGCGKEFAVQFGIPFGLDRFSLYQIREKSGF